MANETFIKKQIDLLNRTNDVVRRVLTERPTSHECEVLHDLAELQALRLQEIWKVLQVSTEVDS